MANVPVRASSGDGLSSSAEEGVASDDDGMVVACCEACGVVHEVDELRFVVDDVASLADEPVFECADCGGPVYALWPELGSLSNGWGIEVPIEVPVGLDLSPLVDGGAW